MGALEDLLKQKSSASPTPAGGSSALESLLQRKRGGAAPQGPNRESVIFIGDKQKSGETLKPYRPGIPPPKQKTPQALEPFVAPFRRTVETGRSALEGLSTLTQVAALRKQGRLAEADKLLRDFQVRTSIRRQTTGLVETPRQAIETGAQIGGLVGGATSIAAPLVRVAIAEGAAGGLYSGAETSARGGSPGEIAFEASRGFAFGAIGGHALRYLTKGLDFVPSAKAPKVRAEERYRPQKEPTIPGTRDVPATAARVENIADVVGRPVGSRISRLAPEGKQIVREFEQVDDIAVRRGAEQETKIQPILRAPVRDRLDLTDYLEGRKKLSELPPSVQPIAPMVRRMLRQIGEEAKTLKLKIRTKAGKEYEFRLRKNYAPHITPDISDLKGGAVRQRVIEGAVRRNEYPDPIQASRALDRYIEFVESGGQRNSDFFARRLVQTGQAKTVAEARGMIIRYFRPSRIKKYGQLERAREADFGFWEPDPAAYLPMYIQGAQRRFAEAEVWGGGLKRLTKFVGSVARKNPAAAERLSELLDVARGVAKQPSEQAALARVLRTGRQFSIFKFTPLTTLLNLTQSLNSLLASNHPAFLKGFVKTVLGRRQVAVRNGSLSAYIHREFLRAAGLEGRAAGRYLKAIGFSKSEQVLRTLASNVGDEYLRFIQSQLRKNPERWGGELAKYGLDGDRVARRGAVTEAERMTFTKRFTDATMFRGRPMDLPAWFTRSEFGRTIAQFKSFATQQGRFVADNTIGEIRSGNYGRFSRNLAILLTVYPAAGEAVADLRELLTGREREARGLRRYVEDMFQVGAFGIVADSLRALRGGNMLEFAAGPTFSSLADGLTTMVQLTFGDEAFGDKQKRDLLRLFAPPVAPFISERLFPSTEPKKNMNLRRAQQEISFEDPTFGTVTIPLARFSVDGKNVDLKKEKAKAFYRDMEEALQGAMGEARRFPSEKQKEEFDRIWKKSKAEVKNRWEGTILPNDIYGPNREEKSDANLFRVVANYGKGIIKDPENTLRALFTEERLREVVGDTATFERQKFLSLLDQGDKQTEVDHIIPLALGGTNDPSNLRIIPTVLNEEKSRLETRLQERVRRGEISGDEARAQVREFVDESLPGIPVNYESPETEKQSSIFPGLGLGAVAAGILRPGLTTKVLKQLEGKGTVAKQFIMDLTNQPQLKQAERDLIRRVAQEFPDKVSAKDFANRVKTELLPLQRKDAAQDFTEFGTGGKADYKYEGVSLPDELRGPVANYSEHIYNSPIRTSAGSVHFPEGRATENYFAHTRVEDLPAMQNGVKPFGFGEWKSYPQQPTRRIIELQSDLMQKGRLEEELAAGRITQEQYNRLVVYRNDWAPRTIREEVKQAAKDGKTKLQFPTGETAIKIEGLGAPEGTTWSVIGKNPRGNPMLELSDLKSGLEIYDGTSRWIITDVLGDGKFKAVPKREIELQVKNDAKLYQEYIAVSRAKDPIQEGIENFLYDLKNKNVSRDITDSLGGMTETFDISGKVDTSNPIYRFYEKEVGKYLTNKYGAKRITDPQGVSWYELNVPKEAAKAPVEAFGVAALGAIIESLKNRKKNGS